MTHAKIHHTITGTDNTNNSDANYNWIERRLKYSLFGEIYHGKDVRLNRYE